MLSCTYINGKTGESVKLTDEDGCSVRPDLTTAFYKIRETANPNSDLTIYTYFRVLFFLMVDLEKFKQNIMFPRV